jgi:hypothetical protein
MSAPGVVDKLLPCPFCGGGAAIAKLDARAAET